ncbi:MAG TPA: hypothetical protein VIX18_08325, partial [Nitrospirota bacterium]
MIMKRISVKHFETKVFHKDFSSIKGRRWSKPQDGSPHPACSLDQIVPVSREFLHPFVRQIVTDIVGV